MRDCGTISRKGTYLKVKMIFHILNTVSTIYLPYCLQIVFSMTEDNFWSSVYFLLMPHELRMKPLLAMEVLDYCLIKQIIFIILNRVLTVAWKNIFLNHLVALIQSKRHKRTGKKKQPHLRINSVIKRMNQQAIKSN